jgi:hypothetical protein
LCKVQTAGREETAGRKQKEKYITNTAGRKHKEKHITNNKFQKNINHNKHKSIRHPQNTKKH